jgi:hypothetical protein
MVGLFDRKRMKAAASAEGTESDDEQIVPANGEQAEAQEAPVQVENANEGNVSMASEEERGDAAVSERIERARRAAAGQDQATQVSDTELDRLDRIRDILFGKEMQGYEKKLAGMEDRLVKESTELRSDLRRRLESLEVYVKKELESLVSQVRDEQKKRETDIEDVSGKLKESAGTLDRRIAELDEKSRGGEREIREQILNQTKSMTDELQQKYEEFETLVEQGMQELRADKVGRSTLASLLKEMSMRINRELDNLGISDLR